ncbi:MAG: glycosyltransferase family 4 protein [archaeon]
MKIALVYDVIYPYVKGGVEKRVHDLAAALSDRHDVHIYGMKYWPGGDDMVEGGVHYHGVCRAMDIYADGRRSLIQPLVYSLSLLKIFKEDYDLIDCQNFPYFPFFVCRAYSMIKRVPLVLTWHELWGDNWKQQGPVSPFGRFVERLVLMLSENNAAVSKTTAGKLRKSGKTPVVLSNFINCKQIDSVSPAKGSDVVFVGRLIREKNIELLIDAVEVLSKKHKVTCTVIGEGPELARLKRISSKVTFRPFLPQDKLYSFLKGSRVFVLPSAREGFSITTLEAMACGLPIVTVDHPGNAAKDLVRGNGFICRLNASAIASAILSAIKKRKQLGGKSYRIAQSFDIKEAVNNIETYYRSLL